MGNIIFMKVVSRLGKGVGFKDFLKILPRPDTTFMKIIYTYT